MLLRSEHHRVFVIVLIESCGLTRVFFSQRDVHSDPEAVQRVAAAANNLLDSLASLAVEVRPTPDHGFSLFHRFLCEAPKSPLLSCSGEGAAGFIWQL